MDLFYKIAFIAINLFFLVAYLVNVIINIIRDLNSKKTLKTNPKTIDASVKDIRVTKKKIYMVVEFNSPTNLVLFSHTYEFSPAEWQSNTYEIGQQVTLLYNEVKDLKKVRNFPLLISGKKIGLESGPLFTNCLMLIVPLYCSYTAISAVVKEPAKKITELWNGMGTMYVFLILIIYTVLLSYLVESLISAPKADNYAYLKIYGMHAKARVITFKLGGSKNNRGFKESRMTIEYSTNKGEQMKTTLGSYMYTETQEEYIDIIYDEKNPKNVVYLKK